MECAPKWQLLQNIVDEIKQEYLQKQQQQQSKKAKSLPHKPTSQQVASCQQVESVNDHVSSGGSSSGGSSSSDGTRNNNNTTSSGGGGNVGGGVSDGRGRVLIVVKDQLAMAQLRDFLLHGRWSGLVVSAIVVLPLTYPFTIITHPFITHPFIAHPFTTITL
jgi:hypothetical protein